MFQLIVFFLLISSSLVGSHSPIVIGVSGGTGSGKTTLAKKIQSSLRLKVAIIEQDCYYRDLSHLPFDERSQTNFDHPSSIDFERLCQDILALRRGESIRKPIYNFKTHSREQGYHLVEPADVIIVEGILIFTEEKIRKLFDLKIFVDTDHDVRILRRIERDILERGRDFSSVTEQYLKTVRPMHQKFVEPSKQYADIIIPGESDTSAVIKLILSGLHEQVKN